jgi:predicted nuclease of predicted toxin-antitoxin system
MKFLIDAQLPPALVSWLAEQGFEAQHVANISMSDASDAAIWDFAIANGFIIITKDEDFAERAFRTTPSPVIIWFRLGNSTNRALLQWLWPRWDRIKLR